MTWISYPKIYVESESTFPVEYSEELTCPRCGKDELYATFDEDGDVFHECDFCGAHEVDFNWETGEYCDPGERYWEEGPPAKRIHSIIMPVLQKFVGMPILPSTQVQMIAEIKKVMNRECLLKEDIEALRKGYRFDTCTEFFNAVFEQVLK